MSYIKSQEALKAAYTVQQYCLESTCINCCFYTPRQGCDLKKLPEQYDISVGTETIYKLNKK